MPLPPSAAAWSSTRAPPSIARDSRGKAVFQKLAEEEKEHLGTLEARYRELLAQDPQLESRPTFLFFKGAANGLFAAGAEELKKGVNDRQALMIGIRCERGSHRFFKRYGERFEDSEGKQMFLEFADEERNHLELLIREYRGLMERQRRRGRGRARKPRHTPRGNGVIDLHLHTRASDGALEPAELVRRLWRAGIRTFSVTDHDTVAGIAAAAAAAAQYGMDCVPGIEITAIDDGRDVHVLGYFIDPGSSRLADFLASGRAERISRARELAARLEALGMPIDVNRIISDTPEGRAVGRPLVAQALVRAGFVQSIAEAFDRWIGEGRPAFVARTGPAPERVIERIHEAGGLASVAHPGPLGRDDSRRTGGRERPGRAGGVSRRS